MGTHLFKFTSKVILSIVVLAGLGFCVFYVWLMWIEPYQVKNDLLSNLCDKNLTVAARLDQEKEFLKGTQWECSASDVAASCKIYSDSKTSRYLWGIDSKGFYPANGRTMRLCPDMAAGLDLRHYSDDEIIPGNLFINR